MQKEKGLSVVEVSHRLKEEWRRWKSVSKLKVVINVITHDHSFDLNTVEDGDTVLDILSWINGRAALLPMVASLVEAGARPEITRDLIMIRCIENHLRVCLPDKISCRSPVHFMTILLNHGATLNEVHWTERGVNINSRCLRYLLLDRGVPYGCPDYVELAILFLVHGAYIHPKYLVPYWFDATHAVEPDDDTELLKDYKRLLRYFRFTGHKSLSVLLCNEKVWKWEVIQCSAEHVQSVGILTQVREYFQSLEPRPESLQFQCRRVIRKRLIIAADGKSILNGIDDLPLPVILCDYLKFKDVEPS